MRWIQMILLMLKLKRENFKVTKTGTETNETETETHEPPNKPSIITFQETKYNAAVKDVHDDDLGD